MTSLRGGVLGSEAQHRLQGSWKHPCSFPPSPDWRSLGLNLRLESAENPKCQHHLQSRSSRDFFSFTSTEAAFRQFLECIRNERTENVSWKSSPILPMMFCASGRNLWDCVSKVTKALLQLASSQPISLFTPRQAEELCPPSVPSWLHLLPLIG